MVEAGSHDETRRMTESLHRIGVIGAGAMGRGIAQLFASAGLPVRLYDSNPQTVEQALAFNRELLERAVAKGKLSPEALAATMQRLLPTHSLDELADCDLLIEAIIEDLGAKQALLAELEKRVAPDAVLASNTSSLSITRIAARCRHPERVAGFHFFNPVTLMRIVEVVHGQRTDESVVRRLSRLAEQAGHFPAVSPGSPGFIVNHAGRAFSTEALRILGEGIASPAQIDRILRDGVGFRMGPFELLDLTALDVSHPVMESIYRQFFDEPRFRPSPITTVRLAGGLIGRKAGEGFYVYADGQKQVPAEPPVPALPENLKVWVSPKHAEGYARAAALVEKLGATLVTGSTPDADALILVTPYGEDVSTTVSAQSLNAARTVGLDTLYAFDSAKRRTIMVSPATEAKWRDAAHALLAADGVPVTVIEDSPGFIAQRIVATIVNIASDIAQQQIATPKDIDLAVTLGLGYPVGPLALGDKLGADRILEILKSMQRVTGDPRYRPSLWLQRRVQLGMSLTKAAGEQ